ncbi:hypothetical protein VOI54_10840 [Tamlana sp. 2201CG12-4]|uniref:Crp/Fnr family transcriptional regulator n=1 Tax=Tamlana sp. 2201CG12-4 TaxID=3112582 RepID=UPI002DBCDD36|nr:hypothetical protein [Tamlana sp. 2201CG12-4]MEC3907516.1 hypothetical protein [Tamlana sp. 2201CG12-4]
MINNDFNILSRKLEKAGTPVNLQSHKTLIEFNEIARKLFFVKKGGVVLYHIHPTTGEERAINFFIPDYHPIATIAESFAYDKPSKYRLATFTNSQLIEISKDTITELRSDSEFAEIFQNYGIMTLLDKNELRAMLISLNSEEMLQYLHTNLPQIIQQVPSKYIANFLGITPQWLSKLKHKL